MDIQVNLEIEVDGDHASALEQALVAAGFAADPEHAWRWLDSERGTIVKIEFLCDLEYEPAESLVTFTRAKTLGAINLRGTGYAARDWILRELTASIDGHNLSARVRFAALAGYLIAKGHALRSRRLAKDMYDFAYVLVHNDAGGPGAAAEQVIAMFGHELPSLHTTFREVAASFSSPTDAGPSAYAKLAFESDPESERALLAADAYAAVNELLRLLYP